MVIDDSKIPESSPIRLISDKLKLILPGLANKYGDNKGVYLKLNNVISKNILIVSSRLVINIGFDISLIVD
jgi:hypothetical protein